MKKILLTLCIFIFLAGCAKNDSLVNKEMLDSNGYKSSIASVYGFEDKFNDIVDSYKCGKAGYYGIINLPTLYNAAFKLYLAAEVNHPSEGPWEWSKVLLKKWEENCDREWRPFQLWRPVFRLKLGKNKGLIFTFQIGRSRDKSEYTMTYYPPSGEMVLLKNPPAGYQTEFEFVAIECKKDSKDPNKINSRGYLIDPKTNRMIKAGPQRGIGRILAKLGTYYTSLNYLSEEEKDEYSWETSTTTYK